MKRPWMPLYIGDYLADTGHLTTREHGAYLLLIMHYWQNDGLPADDRKLARIAKVSLKEWASLREVMSAFFTEGTWRHDRIEQELEKVRSISSKRSASAQQRHHKNYANAHQMHTHSHSDSDSQKERKKDAADAAKASSNGKTPEAQLYERAEQVLGKGCGGLVTKLRKAKGDSIPLARAAIETAATKHNPREYVAAVIRGGTSPPDDYVDPRL